MDIADVKHLMNRSGVVIMEFLVDHPPYPRGSKAGFHPREALGLFERGAALFAARPNIRPAQLRNPLDNRIGGVPAKKEEQAVTPARPVHPDGAVEIPENWEKIHHLKRTHIAARIKGVDFKDVGGDERAKEIIREEIARRDGKGA